MAATVGDAASRVIGSLSGTPVLMLIILLNIAMIGTAGWFLLQQEHYRHAERLKLAELLEVCLRKEGPAGPR